MESGIIPAYAGNTRSECARFHFRRDHPRVCGEHFRTPIRGRATRGSSPRMRGTLPSTIRSAETRGIIPAYAGNTTGENTFIRPTRDHPRVCGEHLPPARCPHAQTGSSPRMRGTPTASGVGVPLIGIIPAYAGNTGDNMTNVPQL